MASSDDFPGDASELNTTGSDAVTEEAADEEEEGNGKKEETRDISTSKNSCCGFIKVKLSLLEDEIRTQSKDLELIQKEVSEIKAISQEFPPSCVDLGNTELVDEKEKFSKTELEFPDKNRQRHGVCDLLGQTHEELMKRNWLAKQLRKEISRFKKYTFEYKNKLQVTNSKAEEKQQNSNGLKTENCQMCKFCMSHGDFQNSSVKYEESDSSVIEDLQEENEMLKDCLQKIHRRLRTFRFSESLGYKDTTEDPHYFPVNENTPLYVESVYNSFENFCEFYCKLQEELFKLRHALMTAEKNSFEHVSYSTYAPENQAVYYGSSKETFQGNTREFRERYDRFSDEKVYSNEKKYTRTMKQNFASVPYSSKMESSGDLVYTDHRHKYLKKENRLQNELLYAQKQLEVLHSKIFEAVQLVRDVELEGNSNETLVEMVASIAEECNALRQEVSYLRKLRQEQRKSWNRLRHFIMDSEKRFEREGRNPSNVGDIVRNLGNMIASSESSSLDEAILYMYNNQLEWLEHFYGIRESTNIMYDGSQDNIDDGSIAPLEGTEPRGCAVFKKSVSTQTVCQCIQQQRHWCKPLLENRMNDVSVQADEFFLGSDIPMEDEYDPASCMEVNRGIYVVHEEQEESENMECDEASAENVCQKPSESVSDSEAEKGESSEQPFQKTASLLIEAQPGLPPSSEDTEHSDNSDQHVSECNGTETQNQAEQDKNNSAETQSQEEQQDENSSAETQSKAEQQDENSSAETQSKAEQQDENSSAETQSKAEQQDENSSAETQSKAEQQDENSNSETQSKAEQQDENSSAETQIQAEQQDENSSAETQIQAGQQHENSSSETQSKAEQQDENSSAETQSKAEQQDENSSAETQSKAEQQDENCSSETQSKAEEQDENSSAETQSKAEQQDENSSSETQSKAEQQDGNSRAETQSQAEKQSESSGVETQKESEREGENVGSEVQNQTEQLDENSNAETQNQAEQLDESSNAEAQNQTEQLDQNSSSETLNLAEKEDESTGEVTQNQEEQPDENSNAETQNQTEQLDENNGAEIQNKKKEQNENSSEETQNETEQQDEEPASLGDEQSVNLPKVVVTDCSPGADLANESTKDDTSKNGLSVVAQVKDNNENASYLLSVSQEPSDSLNTQNRPQDTSTEVSSHRDSATDENGSHHVLPYPSSHNEVTLYPVRATEGFIPFSLTPDNVSVIQNYTVSTEGGEVITYENTTQDANMVDAVYSFLHKLNDSFSHGAKGNYWNLFLLRTLNNEAYSVAVERNDSPSSDGTESPSDAEENEEAGTGNDANSDSVPSELNRCSLKYVFYDAFSNNKIEFITDNTLPCVLYSTSPPGVNVLLPNTLPSNFNLLSPDFNYLTCMPKKLHAAKGSYATEHSMSEHNGKVWLDPSSSTDLSDSIKSWLNPITHTVYYSHDEQLSKNSKVLSVFEESLIIVSIVPKILGNVNGNVESKYIVFERVQSLDQLRNNGNVCVSKFISTRRGTFEIDAADVSELRTLNALSNCGEESKSDDAEKENNSDENLPNNEPKTEEMPVNNFTNNEINVLKKYIVKISPSRSSEPINMCPKCSANSSSDVPNTSAEISRDLMCEVYNVPPSSNAINEDSELNDNAGPPVSVFRICSVPIREETSTEPEKTEQPSSDEKEVSEEIIEAHTAPELALPAKPVEEDNNQDADHGVPNFSSVDSAVVVSEPPMSLDSTVFLDATIQTDEDDFSSLKQKIQELEMSLEEIDDVKKQHLQVTCDMAEQIEIYKQKENAYEQKLDIAERRRMTEVELAHQEHSLRESSLKDEIAALKENLDQQNAVLQRLKDDSEETNKLLLEKEERIIQHQEVISNLNEKLAVVEGGKETSLEHSDSQTDELEELVSYEQLKEEVSKLKQEAEEMSRKLVQQREAVVHVKSQLRATINHLQSLKDAALKQLQKQRKQLLQAIQERQQLYDAEVQIARQRREIEKKDDLLDSQSSQIGVMQEKMISMEEELKTKSAVVEEYEQKYQEKEKHDFWCQIMDDELECLQGGKTKSEKTLETLENQTVVLNELRQKFQNLESIRSVVEELKNNVETMKLKKEVRPEVASSKEENQVQKLLSISEHTYLNLVGKLCEALKLKDLKGAKTLKLSTWLENEDLVEARRDDHRKILHTLERLKADAYNAHEPSSHDWKRLMAESMYFSERKTSSPMCHSEDAHYQYLSEVLRRAQESLAREHYLKVSSQQRTVATAGSGRSERRSSSRERRVPLELKNGKILAMLDVRKASGFAYLQAKTGPLLLGELFYVFGARIKSEDNEELQRCFGGITQDVFKDRFDEVSSQVHPPLTDKVNHKELLPNKHEYHKMDSKNCSFEFGKSANNTYSSKGSTTKKSRNT